MTHSLGPQMVPGQPPYEELFHDTCRWGSSDQLGSPCKESYPLYPTNWIAGTIGHTGAVPDFVQL